MSLRSLCTPGKALLAALASGDGVPEAIVDLIQNGEPVKTESTTGNGSYMFNNVSAGAAPQWSF